MAKNRDHTGFDNGFVRLLARIRPGHRKYMSTKSHYVAQCVACGTRWVVDCSNVIRGHTRSCGCLSGALGWKVKRERYGKSGMARLRSAA